MFLMAARLPGLKGDGATPFRGQLLVDPDRDKSVQSSGLQTDMGSKFILCGLTSHFKKRKHAYFPLGPVKAEGHSKDIHGRSFCW